jgi:dienelactone hydrolase
MELTVRRWAVLLAGAGWIVLLGHEGTLAWRAVRAAAALVVTAGVLRVARRRGRGAAATAGAIGVVSLATGAGIAVPHLDGGGALLTTTGVVLVVSGGALVVLGAIRLLRDLPLGARLAAVPAAVVVLALAVRVVAPAVAATNVPASPLDRRPAAVGLAARTVHLATPDGQRLDAWFVPSRTGAAVVLLHGAGSTRSSLLDHAAVLARHGFGALLVDARGHGTSGGRAMDFGWYGDHDVAAAVSWLRYAPGVDPDRIGAVGLSMGGEEALGALGAVPELRAVVAEGATGRVADDGAWLSGVYGWRGALQEGLDHLVFGLTDLLSSAAPPRSLRDAVRSAPRTPVLLIAAGDVTDEAHAAATIHAASPATVEVWVAPDAGHTDALAVHPGEWERRVTGFLADALAPRSPGAAGG